MNFALVLFLLLLATGVLWLIDRLYARKHRAPDAPAPWWVEYGASFFPVILIVFGPDTRAFPTPFPIRMIQVGNAQISTLELTITGIALLLLLGLQAMLRRTRLGLAMRAIAQDGRVAGLMGIDTNRVVALAFGVGAAVGGVGGVLTGIYYNSVDIGMGYSAGLKGFSAMVIGGMGSLPGAILGGFLLGAAETAATAAFWSGYRDIVAFSLLILVLIVRPSGLLGTPEIRKV